MADLDPSVPVYSAHNLPTGDDGLPIIVDTWPEYQKAVTTKMLKIDGPFYVESDAGTLLIEDGFLAMDVRGYAYGIATEEQNLIYKIVGEAQPDQTPPTTTTTPEGENK